MDSSPNIDSVRVSSSSIEGSGLFTKRPFKKGEVVMEWNPNNTFLSQREVENLPEDLKRYVAKFKDTYLLIAEPERYLNHSCDPNTETNADGLDIALRDIQEGEELTGSYRHVPTYLGFNCRCGSLNCDGQLQSLGQ